MGITFENFKDGLYRLRVNMGKPAIEPKMATTLYDELSWIPPEAWPDIVTQALDAWDAWPRNFPKAIKYLWYEWQGKRAAPFEEEDCRVCDGEGVLRFFKNGYEYVGACGHCKNYRKVFHESAFRFTTQYLKDNGFEQACCFQMPYCKCND